MDALHRPIRRHFAPHLGSHSNTSGWTGDVRRLIRRDSWTSPGRIWGVAPKEDGMSDRLPLTTAQKWDLLRLGGAAILSTGFFLLPVIAAHQRAAIQAAAAGAPA